MLLSDEEIIEYSINQIRALNKNLIQSPNRTDWQPYEHLLEENEKTIANVKKFIHTPPTEKETQLLSLLNETSSLYRKAIDRRNSIPEEKK